MLQYARAPLLFLFAGSLLGLLLRWQFISPTPGVNYTFFLHGHSHVMILGWIFNVLYIVVCHNYIPKSSIKPFRNLFLVLQILTIGMLVSFPLQGYGVYSIILSTLHTICAVIFIVKVFTQIRHVRSFSAWNARVAMIFFIVSAAGPFALGYLMANDMGQSPWYYFSIYFYLHFQYNGFFLFGLFSLLFSFLEQRNVSFDHGRAKLFGWIMAGACVPAYLLSVLWAKPGILFNLTAGLSAAVQLVGFGIMLRLLFHRITDIRKVFRKSSTVFFSVVLLSFFIKLVLQLASSFPEIAQLAYELRPVVIAYLHLVLIGVISLGLLVWYLECGLLSKKSGRNAIAIFLLAFTGMEACLIISPWWTNFFGVDFPGSSTVTLIFSVLLSFSCLLLILSMVWKTDKNQYSP